MSDAIESNKAFFVTEPAWHGLGTVLTDAPTVDEAWKLAYPHTLFKMDLQAVLKGDDGHDHTMPLKHSKVIMRDDGIELNTVSDTFELVQPYEVLNNFRPLLDTGKVKLESGGSLHNGSVMWALGKIESADAEIVKGDPLKGYFLISTGFDGRMRVSLSRTNVRVVCANTLAAAIGHNGQRADFKFKHTKNVRDKIENAVGLVKREIETFHKQVDQYKSLATKKVTFSQMKAYVQNVFLTEEEKEAGEISGKKKTILTTVTDLIDSQKGLEYVPAIRGTAWQAYNAVSEYVTHNYGRTQESRVYGQWFGESALLNKKALTLALAM